MDIQAGSPISSVSAPAVPGKREVVPDVPVAAPPVPQAASVQPVVKDLQQTLAAVAEQLREYLQSTDRDLEFRVDSDTHATVITVRDATTGDVIRQIPNEEALRMMRYLNAESGTFVNLTA